MSTTTTLSTVDEIGERVADLQRLAGFLADRPELTAGHTFLLGDTLTVFADDLAHLHRLRKLVGPTIDDPLTKDGSDTFYSLVKSFGSVKLELSVYRSKSCERVQTGTVTVERPIMVQSGVETVEEPVFKWVCDESIRGAA